MQKINFQDLPNTDTPYDANTFNLLQDNVENAINTTETTLESNISNVQTTLQSAINEVGEDSGWIEPTLINGSKSSSTVYYPKYRKIGKTVQITGVVTSISGSNVVLFTLPEGFRPNRTIRWLTNIGNSVTNLASFRITSDGEFMQLNSTYEDTSHEVTIDYMFFID